MPVHDMRFGSTTLAAMKQPCLALDWIKLWNKVQRHYIHNDELILSSFVQGRWHRHAHGCISIALANEMA